MTATAQHPTLASVRDYYGRVLQGSKDLKTTACCAIEGLPGYVRELAAGLAPEVVARFYGCGIIAPAGLSGATVLDLGSGSGRDVYILSALVGEHGRVIGLDMTAEQLEVARRYQDHHRQAWGHTRSNVRFIQGIIEEMVEIEDESVDFVVSNCVINLSPAKELVFDEIFRVLKPGGELHFSDVFVDRRLDTALMEDPVILGECLAGAMYAEDFRRMLARVGCLDTRVLKQSPIAITDEDIAARLGLARFESRTVRAFKLPLEDRCEDYGQVATYLGTLPHHPHGYALDDHHFFETGRPMLVCGNTAMMVENTRLGAHFKVQGDRSRHFGLFDCGPAPAPGASAGGACC